MPRPFAKEFRDDVIRVVLNRDVETMIGSIAKDLGIHDATLARWLCQIVTSIERTDHRRRRQARLGRLTPVECEKQS